MRLESVGRFTLTEVGVQSGSCQEQAVVDMGSALAKGGLLTGARAKVDFAQHLRAGDSQYQFVGKTGPFAMDAEGTHSEAPDRFDAITGATVTSTVHAATA